MFLCSLSPLVGDSLCTCFFVLYLPEWGFSLTHLFLRSLSPWIEVFLWLTCFFVLYFPEWGILFDWPVSLFSTCISLSVGFSLTDLFLCSLSPWVGDSLWLTCFFVLYLPEWEILLDWPVSLFSIHLTRQFSLTNLFLCSLSPWVGNSLWLTCFFVLYLPE